MPFIPVSGVVQAEMVFTWDSQFVENVLHYRCTVDPDVPNMIELGAALVDLWDTAMQILVPNTVALVNIKLTDLSSATGPGFDYSAGLPLVGSLASPALPNNVTCVFTKNTALRGRSYRGRIYHIGLGESQVADNAVLNTPLVAIGNTYNAFRIFVESLASWNMVVVSRETNNAPRVTGVATDVIGITSDGVIDSQRRRLPGRGS